ncbi:MAG TPA: ABC transporter ATP-binding protein [Candidatus Dormibacteraeota bacterium]|nr:ABC transporter ATP-binding protein [Candidatus Dormibacteraeota bacterium]
MSAAVQCVGLGRRYGKVWALRDCSMSIPRGSVAALVGPNGAGKTTLLEIAVGLLDPTEGELRILSESVRGQTTALLAQIGFVAQDAPLYRSFSVADMLRFGRHTNRTWDDALARERLRRLDIPLDRPCGQLSGGQQAQVALTVAVAKRPQLLLLDEPVARLDPLARREFLESLMEIVSEGDVTVLLSSHMISDLERVCDHLVLLQDGHVALAGATDALIAGHRLLSGPRRDLEDIEHAFTVIDSRSTERQMTLLVRGNGAVHDPRVEVTAVNLEDLVLAYLRRRRPIVADSHRELSGVGS